MKHLFPCLLLLLAVTLCSAYLSPCPSGCRCTSPAEIRRRHHWHNLLAAYRMRAFAYGRSKAGRGFRIYRPNFNQAAHSKGREMTCLGLGQMPDIIPSDVKKLTFYGDIRKETYQKDSPAGGSRRRNIPTLYHQLTAITKNPFARSSSLEDLNIEGNRIKILHSYEFDMLGNLQRLRMKNNRMKQVMDQAFAGLPLLNELDLSKNQLKKLAPNAFSDNKALKKLILSDNRLKQLDGGIFSALYDLETLDLSGNLLQTLHRDIFRSLQNIQELKIDNNNLREIGYQFSTLSTLRILSLKGNRITSIDVASFSGLPNMEELYLARNEIQVLPRDVFLRNEKVTKVDMSKNKIYHVADGAFKNAASVRRLDLSGNKLQGFTNETMKGLDNLEVMILSNNNLLEVQQGIFLPLLKMYKLDLSHNQIKSVKTKNFYGLKNLRELKLDHNEIKVLEDKAFTVSMMSQQSRLTWLYLQYNLVSDISGRQFYGMPHLKYLTLAHNRLENIQDRALSMVTRLHTLSLNDNKLTKIPRGMFKRMKHVRHINLGLNNVQRLERGVFKGLIRLEDLNLNGNQLVVLDPKVLDDVKQIVGLNLKSNKFKAFDLDMLKDLSKVRYLDLSKNRIAQLRLPQVSERALFYLNLADNEFSQLEPEVTRSIVSGGSIHLYGNPWTCDCRLRWILDEASDTRIKVTKSDDIICKGPPQVAGEKVTTLRPHDMQCGRGDDTNQVPRDQASQPWLSCDLTDLGKQQNTRKNMKTGKQDVYQWYYTLTDTNMTSWCTGVQLTNNWFLSPSSCWKGRSQGTMLNVFKATERDVFSEAEVGRVEFYQGRLDIALVQIKSDIEEKRQFPCILSSQGTSAVLAEEVYGIALAQSDGNTRKQRSGRVKGLIQKVTDGLSCGITDKNNNDLLCLQGNTNKDNKKKQTSHDNAVPFFVKAGRSRWAVAGLDLLKSDSDSDGGVTVNALHPAVRWMEQIMSS